jgi:hypothetical protein
VKFLLAASVLSASLAAQVVRVLNYGTTRFDGWHRTTVDVMPPFPAGEVGGATYVVGRRVGEATWVVDVHVALAAGQQIALDLALATPSSWTLGAFPSSIDAFFGGLPIVDGHALQLDTLQADGAGWSVHMHTRPRAMCNVDMWFTWYPDQPGCCEGEVAITASDPTVPDLYVWLDAPFPLTFGAAVVLPLGGQPQNLLPQGLWLADGQARVLPLTFLWPHLLQNEHDWSVAVTVANRAIGAVGIQQLLASGNPVYPPGFSARTWIISKWPEAIRRLHTMEGPVCGPNMCSPVSGYQEDETFVRGEALLPDGVGAEQIAYFSALKLAARPCHHLEASGSPLDLAAHTNPPLVFWDGRPHWSTVVSPDRLGKVGGFGAAQTGQWWGPDVEHWLMNTLAAATRLTGSPACQWLLAHQARIYLLQLTSASGLVTSMPFASRAVGWEGILAVHLWRELEDRALASEVRTRWQNRATNVILPAYGNRPCDIWDPRLDDPRFGTGWWYSPWQQAVGAYGLDLACEVLGPASGRPVALAAALEAMRDGYMFQNGVWVSRSAMALDGRYVVDPTFHLFGTPLAPAVVLRHLPAHPIALSIWNQLHVDATAPEHFSWFAPGVQ